MLMLICFNPEFADSAPPPMRTQKGISCYEKDPQGGRSALQALLKNDDCK
jgi:hypothetical protein